MTSWIWLLRCFALLSFTATCAAQGDETFNLTISDLPQCGLSCLINTVPEAGCSFTDTQCQCESKELAKSTVACMLANCTMADSLQTAKVQASLCHLPNPSRSNQVIVLVAILFALSGSFIVARVISKAQVSWSIGADDACIIVAILIAIVSVACVIEMSKLGFGKHLWGLQPGHLKRVLRLFYIAEVNYVVVLSLVKASLVLFYLRIFPTGRVRIAAWTTLGFIIVSSSIIFFLTVFSCKPIAYFWDRDLHGTCIDVNSLAYANSAIAVVQDFVIISLPLSVLRRLNMQLKKKIAVGFMFAIGSFGCVTSIVRLQSLLIFGNSLDPTWDYIPVVQWTTAELAAGFICACLPSIRVILQRFFPAMFSQWSRTSRSNDRDAGYNLNGSRRSGKGWRSFRSSTPANRDSAVRESSNELPLTALPECTAKNVIFSMNKTKALPSIKKERKERRNEVKETGRVTPTPPPSDYLRDEYPYAHESWLDDSIVDLPQRVAFNHA